MRGNAQHNTTVLFLLKFYRQCGGAPPPTVIINQNNAVNAGFFGTHIKAKQAEKPTGHSVQGRALENTKTRNTEGAASMKAGKQEQPEAGMDYRVAIAQAAQHMTDSTALRAYKILEQLLMLQEGKPDEPAQERIHITYCGGESRAHPGRAIDYMIGQAGDVELYAETEPTEDGTAYDTLKAAIMEQAQAAGIGDRIVFCTPTARVSIQAGRLKVGHQPEQPEGKRRLRISFVDEDGADIAYLDQDRR